MRKLLLIFVLTISTLVASAQSVLGINFGRPYSEVKEALKTRFGKFNVEEDKGVLAIYDFNMGSIHFNSGKLYFQWDGQMSKFYRAEFQKWDGMKNVESMKNERMYLKGLIASKYKTFEFKNSQGFICYEFLGEEINGITMHGEISLVRAKGKDDIERLYLFLLYNPIADFIEENSDF